MDGTEQLPRAHASEEYIIGCLVALPDNADEVFETALTATDFFDAEHQRIFAEAQRQYSAGGIDPVLLGANGATKILVDLGINPDKAPVTAAHVPSEAQRIIEARRKRQLHGIAESAVDGALNGRSSNDVLRGLVADLDDYRREATASNTPRFRLYSAADLDAAEFQTTYYIKDILAANEPCALGGAEKSLKTTIMLDMGISLAVPAGHFLGMFPVAEPKRFMMFSGESSLPTLQETARRICRRAGYELGQLDGFSLSPDLPQLDDVNDIAEFEAIIAGEQPDVVGVDPMMLCLGDIDEKASNMFSMAKLLRRLNEACLNNGATLVFAHHTSGQPQYGATPKLSWLAYSGFKQFVRQWVLLNRMEEYAPGSGLHRLKMVAGGSSGHNGLWIVEIDEGSRSNPGGRHWRVAIKSIDEAKQDSSARAADKKAADAEQKLEADRTAACRVLAKNPKGLSMSAIGERAGIATRRWPKVFAHMFDIGELVECEVTVSNHKKPTIGYRLGDTSNAPK